MPVLLRTMYEITQYNLKKNQFCTNCAIAQILQHCNFGGKDISTNLQYFLFFVSYFIPFILTH